MTRGQPCPAKGCGQRLRRVYAQVETPDGHSTSVVLPYGFCGTPGFARGHGTLTVKKGQHGMVPLAKLVRLGPSRTGPRSPKARRTRGKAPPASPRGG